jgi:3-oxoacyl-(acyl-carrier-protein) synthase/malonyl CoA-acyl carrier protein transacylase/phosphopantetheinyl transferase
MSRERDVAIVGMACLFPGAPDLATFARNLEDGVDAIGDVPAARLDASFFGGDGFYCRRGGFVDAHAVVDPAALGVMPRAAHAMEPDQLLALDIAKRAFADAGLDRSDIDRSKIGVILGKGNYAGPGRARLTESVRGAEQLVRALRQLVPGVSEADLARVRDELRAQVAAAGPDAALGLVPNLAASRIAASLDLGGAAYTVDAACASALVAIDQAVAELRAGRLDAVIAGGVHFCQDEAFWTVFTQLGAVSRSQQIRPFDRRADGVLLGEGAGLVVLRRAADAERDGQRTYAVLRGIGVSSDGRGSLAAPKALGQVLAVERAWRDADVDPASVGLVEAHGTATVAGDGAELETLRRVFGAANGSGRAVLGSVKSMIGHAMPAAGAAGLIKAALAIHRGRLLPTLHCEEPHADLAASRFRAIATSEPWTAPLRRAGVSAFGFGGINAHVVLEGAGTAKTRAQISVPAATAERVAAPRVLALAAADGAALAELIAAWSTRDLSAPVVRDGSGPARIAILDATPERLAKARTIATRGASWRGRDNIYFEPAALAGSLVFAFPGVDASFKPRLADVAARLGRDLAPELSEGVTSIERVGVGLVEAGELLRAALAGLGVHADAACGHSVGEWTAMIASGMFRKGDVAPWVASARTNTLEVPGVAFAALGCGVDKARAAMEGLPDIAVSHDNCPHQVILCGVDASIDEAVRRLRAAGVLGQKLPFRSGFHSPLFAPYLGQHRDNFAAMNVYSPTLPMWSATTCAPFPADEAGTRELAMRHLVEPVRFRELMLGLHDGGARIFVQVGPGSLVGFIEDTLKGKPHLAITANAADRTGMQQLARVAAALWAVGREVRFEWLHGDQAADVDVRISDDIAPSPRSGVALALGVPLVSFAKALTLPQAAPVVQVAAPASAKATAPVAGPLGAAFDDIMGEVHQASADVLAALTSPRAAKAIAKAPPQTSTTTTTTTTTLEKAPPAKPAVTKTVKRLSVETHPWLLDHTFMRQPAGWTTVSDRHPVVPMTTTIRFLMEEAAGMQPGRVAIAVEELKAFRWLSVPAPTDVTFERKVLGPDRILVRAVNYAEAVIVLGDAYPAPTTWAPAPLTAPRPSPAAADTLYDHRWMFHGPAYQGIRTIDAVGDDGIVGIIETGAAPGALLDNAGQLLGLWVMLEADRDRLAMPVGAVRLSFHGAHPEAGERLTCDVRIRLFDERRVVADLALVRADGTPWCVIDQWEDRRFDTDANLWNVLMWPERCLLGEPIEPGGPIVVHDVYGAAPTREQLYRRYLDERERAVHDKQLPRVQRGWLAGRIAAKDAVRHLLWTADAERTMFPIEIGIDNDGEGRPLVLARTDAAAGADVRVSIGHKDQLAVALATVGEDVGVDVERIEVRDESFAATAFTAAERALIQPGDDEAEWLTRLWTAKEAVGKRNGTGLAGNPRALPITDRTGTRLLCAGTWVETRRLGNHVIAWTSR